MLNLELLNIKPDSSSGNNSLDFNEFR